MCLKALLWHRYISYLLFGLLKTHKLICNLLIKKWFGGNIIRSKPGVYSLSLTVNNLKYMCHFSPEYVIISSSRPAPCEMFSPCFHQDSLTVRLIQTYPHYDSSRMIISYIVARHWTLNVRNPYSVNTNSPTYFIEIKKTKSRLLCPKLHRVSRKTLLIKTMSDTKYRVLYTFNKEELRHTQLYIKKCFWQLWL